VLEPDHTRRRTDLTRRLHRLLLAKPCLHALATGGPLRHGELGVALTTARGEAVHSKTLTNALTYLIDNDLVLRRRSTDPDVVLYDITEFGRTVLNLLEAADQAFRRHLHDPDPHQSHDGDQTRPGQ
jgi:DNA-binding HxlR family transcriptional regulator